MKRFIRSAFLFMATGATLLLYSCQKNNNGNGTGPGNGFNILYPTTLSFYEGVNSNYPTISKYQYDKNNLLVKYGTDSVIHEVSTHGVNLVVYSYPYQFLTGYAYKIANQLDTSVSIYSGAPTQLSIDFFSKNVIFGTTTSSHQGEYFRENSREGLLLKEITSDGGGKNINYSYDDKKNLKMIEWVNLTGPRTTAPYARLTVTGLDDKPSPFISVQGYKIASYPQSYPIDYALAYCNNNPTQIKVENYDATKNAMVLYEQDDFTYTYNSNGYPATIKVDMTYYTSTTTHFIRTYTITYK